MRPRRLAAALAVALIGTGAAYVLSVHRGGRDIRGSSTVEYVPSPPPRAVPPAPQLPWPQWGRDEQRTRSAPFALRPPFTLSWVYHGDGSLLEFPPAIGYGRIYMPTFAGRLAALSPGTGKELWRYESGRCAWATPAVASGLVVETFLLRPPACRASVDARGVLVALDARTGAVRWRRAVPATESSPLVAGGLVTIGDWTGTVSAFALQTGRLRWTFRTDGAIKSSPSLAGNRIFIGTYSGSVYALDASTGRQIWRSSSQRSFGGSQFYSTPAIGHGRVYIGSTDGRVYAYGAGSGRLRWSFSTGGYVYASPALWQDIVIVGSYDRHLYALDAATGAVRWTFAAGGRITAGATVLGDVAYVSTLEEKTFALDVRTGRRLWSFPDGKYSAGVADPTTFYLVGAARLFAFTPRRAAG